MKTADPTNLGEVLRRLLLIAPADIARAVEKQRENPSMLFGQALVQTGAITPLELERALAMQVDLRSLDAQRATKANEELLAAAFERATRVAT